MIYDKKPSPKIEFLGDLNQYLKGIKPFVRIIMHF